MIIREWTGEGPLEGIDVIISASTRGWQAYATGWWQPPEDGAEMLAVDASMDVTSRSPSLTIDVLEGAIRGRETAFIQIAQWAITACMVKDQ